MVIQRFILSAQNLTPKEYYRMTKAKKLYVKQHNKCAICCYMKKLEVHHIVPVHIDCKLAADPNNFITLCRNCHFIFGHFHNFRTKWNPEIVEFAEEARNLLEYGRERLDIIVLNAS